MPPKMHFLTTEPELNSHISATWNISTKDLQKKKNKGVGILRQKVASRSEELHTLIKFVSFILDNSEECLPILREMISHRSCKPHLLMFWASVPVRGNICAQHALFFAIMS